MLHYSRLFYTHSHTRTHTHTLIVVPRVCVSMTGPCFLTQTSEGVVVFCCVDTSDAASSAAVASDLFAVAEELYRDFNAVVPGDAQSSRDGRCALQGMVAVCVAAGDVHTALRVLEQLQVMAVVHLSCVACYCVVLYGGVAVGGVDAAPAVVFPHCGTCCGHAS